MKSLIGLILSAVVLGSNAAIAKDYSVFESEIKTLNEEIQGVYDLKTANRYIRASKRFLDKIGVDTKIVSENDEKSLIILPTQKKNNLNKVAYSLDRNFKNLVFEINPHTTIKNGDVGSYSLEKHKFVISKLSVGLLNLSDTTIHHEIRHAMMTYRYLKNSIETVFNYEFLLLKPEAISEKTGYEEYLSLQELSTYPIEALQQLSHYQHRYKMQNDDLLESIEDSIEHSFIISKYMIQFIEKFDLKNAHYEIFSEKYLEKEYRYIKATSLETYQMTIPYFESFANSESEEIFKYALSKSRQLAYDVWVASDEALKAVEKYKSDKTTENLSVLRIKIKALTAASRKYL